MADDSRLTWSQTSRRLHFADRQCSTEHAVEQSPRWRWNGRWCFKLLGFLRLLGVLSVSCVIEVKLVDTVYVSTRTKRLTFRCLASNRVFNDFVYRCTWELFARCCMLLFLQSCFRINQESFTSPFIRQRQLVFLSTYLTLKLTARSDLKLNQKFCS